MLDANATLKQELVDAKQELVDAKQALVDAKQARWRTRRPPATPSRHGRCNAAGVSFDARLPA